MGHTLVSGSNDHTTRFWSRGRPGMDISNDRFHVGRERAKELGVKEEEERGTRRRPVDPEHKDLADAAFFTKTTTSSCPGCPSSTLTAQDQAQGPGADRLRAFLASGDRVATDRPEPMRRPHQTIGGGNRCPASRMRWEEPLSGQATAEGGSEPAEPRRTGGGVTRDRETTGAALRRRATVSGAMREGTSEGMGGAGRKWTSSGERLPPVEHIDVVALQSCYAVGGIRERRS